MLRVPGRSKLRRFRAPSKLSAGTRCRRARSRTASGHLKSLAARAPASERGKLDQHTTALRELEKRLSGQALDCAALAAPDATTFPLVTAFGGGEPYFDMAPGRGQYPRANGARGHERHGQSEQA